MIWCFVILLIIAVAVFSAVAVVAFRRGNKALDETRRIEIHSRDCYFSELRGNGLCNQVDKLENGFDSMLARMSQIEALKGDGKTEMNDVDRFKGSVLAFKKLIEELRLRSELMEHICRDVNLDSIETKEHVDMFKNTSVYLYEKLENLCRIFYGCIGRIKTEDKECE